MGQDLMKRLLLLLPLLLTPAAQAVDYAQCEAMQKAVARMIYTRDEEASRARRESNARFENTPKKGYIEVTAECREKFPGYPLSGDKEARRKCVTDGLMGSAGPMIQAGNDAAAAVRAKWAPRIAKVKADYQAAGCY